MLVGVVLVVASVAGVVRVVSAADQTVDVWTVRNDLATGVEITQDDVQLTGAALGSVAPYFGTSESPVGRVTTDNFMAGALLTRTGVEPVADAADLRWVTLPVERHHLPTDLKRGELVDVYLVERTGSGEPVGDPRLVLADATVAGVDDGGSGFGSSSLEIGVSLSIAAADVAPVVSAEARGTLTLVRVPMGDQ